MMGTKNLCEITARMCLSRIFDFVTMHIKQQESEPIGNFFEIQKALLFLIRTVALFSSSVKVHSHQMR